MPGIEPTICQQDYTKMGTDIEATSLGPENLTGVATNHTTSHPLDSNLEIFLICIFTVTFIVGFIGNGFVIFLTGCRMKTTVNSIWFLNLAISDLIFILTFVIGYFFHNSSLYKTFRYFFTRLLALIRFASVFFLVVISLDRCLCTWMAVWAQNNRTVLRARIISLIVWVLSICCCTPFFIRNAEIFFVTYDFFVSFLIPFLIIASSHIAIAVRIKRLKMGKRLRSYRGIIAVILAFFICFFPYFVCYFCAKTINKLSEVRKVNLIAETFSVYLLFLNSCLNPIIYVFMCDEYKKKLKQSLLLVLESAFAEDYLDVSVKTRTTHE